MPPDRFVPVIPGDDFTSGSSLRSVITVLPKRGGQPGFTSAAEHFRHR